MECLGTMDCLEQQQQQRRRREQQATTLDNRSIWHSIIIVIAIARAP